jgi:hypothetical protein
MTVISIMHVLDKMKPDGRALTLVSRAPIDAAAAPGPSADPPGGAIQHVLPFESELGAGMFAMDALPEERAAQLQAMTIPAESMA